MVTLKIVTPKSKYSVIGFVPGMGKLEHLITAETPQKAADKFQAAHPGSSKPRVQLRRLD